MEPQGSSNTPRRTLGVMNYDDPLVRADAEYHDALARVDGELYDVLVMVTRDSGLSAVEAELVTHAAIRAALAEACDAAERHCESFLKTVSQER
jgi:hypothetical protein